MTATNSVRPATSSVASRTGGQETRDDPERRLTGTPFVRAFEKIHQHCSILAAGAHRTTTQFSEARQ